jgi:hypothetical protein
LAFHYSPRVVTDGLVLYLDAANPYSYVSGSLNWNDLSRSQTSGSLINGPTYSSANLGSIVFDGVDDRVQCPKVITTVAFTVSMWINISTIIRAESNFLTQDVNNDVGRLLLRVLSTGRIEIFIGGNRFSSSSVVSINTWYHITCTRDNSGFGSIYVNGFLDSSGNLNTNLITDTNTVIAYFPRIPGSSFPGRVATTQIYNRALPQIEVLQNYNATKGRFGLT